MNIYESLVAVQVSKVSFWADPVFLRHVKTLPVKTHKSNWTYQAVHVNTRINSLPFFEAVDLTGNPLLLQGIFHPGFLQLMVFKWLWRPVKSSGTVGTEICLQAASQMF